MADDLITDEARAQIGKVTRRAQGTVVLKEAQRFAAACADHNPIYFDDDAARAAGYREMVVPPPYVQYAVLGVTDLAQLREDGILAGGERLPLKVSRVMYGGDEIEFLEPVYDGDEITAETRVVSIEQKDGSRGPFVLSTNETVFTNQHGVLVAKGRSFSIAR